MENSGIGVVVVTFNRLEKLKVALECFEKQRFLPEYVIVVDNASTDGTGDFLRIWGHDSSKYRRIVLRLSSNVGGSGGFYNGLEKAQLLDANWIWVSDDDAYPEKDALKNMAEFIRKHADNSAKIAAVCGMVVSEDGISYAHRRSLIEKKAKILEISSTDEDYCKDYFTVNAFSYVGTAISKQKLLQVGLTNRDFFIYFDDTEHSLRLSKIGDIVCIPSVVIYHEANKSTEDYSWRDYYLNRNYLYMLKQHFSQSIFEKTIKKMKRKFLLKRITFRYDEKYRMREAAMNDAIEGKLGIHPVYRPGWEPTK